MAKIFDEINVEPKPAKVNEYGKKPVNDLSDKPKTTPKLLGVIIQAIIIGLVTFIPRYSDDQLLNAIGNNNGFHGAIMYVFILLMLISSLIMLVHFRKKEYPSEEDSS